MLKQIECCLKIKEFNYEVISPSAVDLIMNCENTDIEVRITCDQENHRIIYYARSSVKIPGEKCSQALEKVNQIHWNGLWNAHLIISEDRCIISQSILYSGNNLDVDSFYETLFDVCDIIDKNFKELMQIVISPDLYEVVMNLYGLNNMAN